MHYYQFNIGDYAKSTRHLTAIEDLAYRRLIDYYYDKECLAETCEKRIARLINLREYAEEVKNVLDDFFDKTEQGYTHSRIEIDIASYSAKADVARANGKKGGRPKKEKPKQNKTKQVTEDNPAITQSVILANPEESGSQANHKPLTNNHKPITNNQSQSKALSAKADKAHDITEEVFEFWRYTMRKKSNTMLTAERKKNIQARIKSGYTIEDFKQAIVNCSQTPHNMGQNDRNQPFNDIELICRTDTHLERFRDSGAMATMPRLLNGTTQQTMNNIQDLELE